MRARYHVTRVLMSMVVAAAACVALASSAFAYPPPATSGQIIQGCASTPPNTSCLIRVLFRDATGAPDAGAPVTFSVSGIAGASVSPTSGTTDANGIAGVTFSAGSGCGTATVTATSGTASVSTTINVPCAGATLPNTSPSPPGTNPLAYLAVALALIVLLAGALTLRQTRRTA